MKWRQTWADSLKQRMELLALLLKRYKEVFRLAWDARDELAGPKRLATERAFLPAALSLQESPPHPAPRRAIALICTAFLVAILWALLGKLDVVAIAPGRIIVSERSKVIQPLEAATVRAIHVKDGQQVQEGQLLIELDSTQVGAEHAQNKQQWLAAQSEKLRAHALQVGMTSGKLPVLTKTEAMPWCGQSTPERCEPWLMLQHQLDTEWQDIRSKHERLTATVQTRAGQIQVAQASIKRLQDLQTNLRQREHDYSALASQGFISQHGLQDRTRDRLDIENELGRVRAEHKTAMAAHHEAIKEQKAYWAEVRKNLSQRSFTAQQDIERLMQEQVKSEQRLNLLELRAPVSGTVQQLAVFTTGGVVTPAQALMVIVPSGHDVAAEVMVANKDIGFVQPGQTVRIKLETYSFTRYGTLDGVVTWVSADALTRDPQNNSNPNNPASNGQAPLAYFPAHIQLKQSSIQIDGKTMPITPGLNVTAEIKTGKRTVMDYLLSPIQKTLDESAGER
jgi:hemolysin D